MDDRESDEGRRAAEAVRDALYSDDGIQEDVIREIMDLLERLESAISQLTMSQRSELVDFVNIIRSRLGPGSG